MAKVRVRMLFLKDGGADPRYDLPASWKYEPGQIVELHPDLAQSWIAGGVAEAVLETGSEPARETASIKPQTEKAILPPASPKKRK